MKWSAFVGVVLIALTGLGHLVYGGLLGALYAAWPLD